MPGAAGTIRRGRRRLRTRCSAPPQASTSSIAWAVNRQSAPGTAPPARRVTCGRVRWRRKKRLPRLTNCWHGAGRDLGAHAELSYTRPLHLVRGSGVFVYTAGGERLLDVYNNVPHVGHAHPAVVRAIAAQASRIASNTRYLDATVLDYAERLTSTMPEGLDACLFVNSGSEANDIAWRIARAHTGCGGALVMANAYHGITEAVTALLRPCSPPAHRMSNAWLLRPAMPPARAEVRARWARPGRARRAGRSRRSRRAGLVSLRSWSTAPSRAMASTTRRPNG